MPELVLLWSGLLITVMLILYGKLKTERIDRNALASRLDDATVRIRDLHEQLVERNTAYFKLDGMLTRNRVDAVEFGNLKAERTGLLQKIHDLESTLIRVRRALDGGLPHAVAMFVKPEGKSMEEEFTEALSCLPDDLKHDAYYQFAFHNKMPSPFPDSMTFDRAGAIKELVRRGFDERDLQKKHDDDLRFQLEKS